MKLDIKKTFRNMKFKVVEYSPEILIAVGVIGTVTSTVMACRATTKVSEILENTQKDINDIHGCVDNESLADQYTEEDVRKDLTIVYTKTGVEFIKLYAPSVVLGVLSMGCMIKSNNIMRKRNLTLAVAYSAVDKGFKEYRHRVINRFGEEVDHDIRFGTKAQKVNRVIADENGKEKKVKETIKVVDTDILTDYSFFFDPSNPNWEKSGDYVRMFLKAQQSYANDRLRLEGVLCLNQVLEMLDIKPMSDEQFIMGQSVGWIYDEERPTGDNYIDFGIDQAYRIAERNFKKDMVTDGDWVNDFDKYDPIVLLDFNVDGNILELLKKRNA